MKIFYSLIQAEKFKGVENALSRSGEFIFAQYIMKLDILPRGILKI